MGHALAREIYDRLLGLEERGWNSHYRRVFGEILEAMSGNPGEEEPQPCPKVGVHLMIPIIAV